MWYFINYISRFFSPNLLKPILKIPSLGSNYEFLLGKAVGFSFFILIIFAIGFTLDNLLKIFQSEDYEKEPWMTTTNEFMTKAGVILVIMVLNFFINKLHLFMYGKASGADTGRYGVFLLVILILYGGLLVLNSNLVPKQFHLTQEVFNKKGYITFALYGIFAIYIISNMFFDPSFKGYLFFFLLVAGPYAFNYSDNQNNWIIYAFFTLFMVDNYRYVTNIKVPGVWKIIHYGLYAFQIALMLFSLTKTKQIFV